MFPKVEHNLQVAERVEGREDTEADLLYNLALQSPHPVSRERHDSLLNIPPPNKATKLQ